MKLSTRSRYGVRMMYELALRYGREPVIIKDIAKRQQISEKYLSKLIIPLKGAKLVSSARGAHGGYVLARDPSKITLREIVEILEGDISPVECVVNGSICSQVESCPTYDLWCGLDRSISGYLEGITLESLVKKAGEPKMPSFSI
jgi:Rrf2 family protein